MPTTLETAATVEPVTLDDLKEHLRILNTDEDSKLVSLIAAARSRVELETGRSLITRALRLTLHTFPGCDTIRFQFPPLLSVTSIKYRDADEVEQTLSSSAYSVSLYRTPGLVRLKTGEVWPTTSAEIDAVTILFTAGYGAAPENVPIGLRLGVLQLAGHFYQHREPVNVGNIVTPIPKTVDYLILPYKVW